MIQWLQHHFKVHTSNKPINKKVVMKSYLKTLHRETEKLKRTKFIPYGITIFEGKKISILYKIVIQEKKN